MHDCVIETYNLTKKYKEQTAVDAVNMQVKGGRICALLGQNGAGKTSLMKLILGLTDISAGEVRVFGETMTGGSRSIFARIGSLVESPSFYPNLTGTENLALYSKLRGKIKKDAVQRALKLLDLPYEDKKPYASYSMGMKQRLGIANSIIHDPELIILDEPVNGLDPMGIADVRALLLKLSHEEGKTILLSSHLLSEISLLADDVAIMHQGRLLEQSSYRQLEAANKKYTIWSLSDAAKASRILEQNFSITDYIVNNSNQITLFGTGLPLGQINTTLTAAGITVTGIKEHHETLEDYFRKLTGGPRNDSNYSG